METWNGFWSEAAPARKLNTFYSRHSDNFAHKRSQYTVYDSQLLH